MTNYIEKIKAAGGETYQIKDAEAARQVDLDNMETEIKADLEAVKTEIIETEINPIKTQINEPVVISSEEYKTNEQFFGKTIYMKTIQTDISLSPNTTTSIKHGISNVDIIWVDLSHSFLLESSSMLTTPVVISTYYTSDEPLTVMVNRTDVHICTVNGGWNPTWKKYVTLRYTKTTTE